MLISLIVAMAHQRVIGYKNQLPWHLPADLRHFKAITLNKPIVMGRKTYESIGKPLPQRTNIILTTDPAYEAAGCQVIHTPMEAMEIASEAEELIIIGGSRVYAAYLPFARRIYMTVIEAEVKGDTFFPELDEAGWELVSREDHVADEKNSYGYRFLVWESLKV
nr:dihydrofolate reductase [uncultured bacterium]